MCLLHTPGLHLDQHFMGTTRQAEHELFIDGLIQQVRDHAVDAVIITSDIFDAVATPSYTFRRGFGRVDQ